MTIATFDGSLSTDEVGLFLAILDLDQRRVAGWSRSERRQAELVCQFLRGAACFAI